MPSVHLFPNLQPEEALTILQVEKTLRLKVDVLTKEKQERMVKLKDLKDKEQRLCDLLCTTPYYIPSGTVPTAEQLETLQEHIDSLTIERVRTTATNNPLFLRCGALPLQYLNVCGNICKRAKTRATEPVASMKFQACCLVLYCLWS